MRGRVLMGLGLALLAAGCTYSPNPASGTLKCGPSFSCPEGYHCTDGKTCWKDGESAGDGGSTTGLDKFVGHWVFGTTGKNVVTCSDQPTMPMTNALTDDYVDIALGTVGDLAGDYYCDWDLNVSGSGTTILPGQTCTTTNTDSKTGEKTTFVWTGTDFVFTTANGSSGTLSATINATYTVDPTTSSCGANCNGTCTLKITGSLAKKSP